MEKKKASWRKKLFKIYLIWSGVFLVALVVVALVESRKVGTDTTSWLTGEPYPDSSYPWRHAALPGVPLILAPWILHYFIKWMKGLVKEELKE